MNPQLQHAIAQFEELAEKYKIILINCIEFKQASELYSKLKANSKHLFDLENENYLNHKAIFGNRIKEGFESETHSINY